MSQSILATFLDRSEIHGNRVAMRTVRTKSGGVDAAMTWREWRDASLAFASAVAHGPARHSASVAILGGNTLTWPIADIGTLLSGKTSVGVYPTSAPSQIEKILFDSAAGVVIVDEESQALTLFEMRSRLPALETIVLACAPSVVDGAISWNDWIGAGVAALSPEMREEITTNARSIGGGVPAIIIYTSGSTGEPKGAILSHGCIAASAASIQDALGLTEVDTTISFLPYSHAAERIFGLYTRIHCGIETALIEDHARLWEVMESFAPTLFGGLPRYYEKLHERSKTSGSSARRILGGNIRVATSGGAPLSVRVAEELHENGVTVLNAYGLTEHLCVAVNRPDDFAFDSVGPPMHGTEIRIAADGEVLVRRSELTFGGYHNLPEDTSAAFTADGMWVYTGDLGVLDSRGMLRITGRKKELLALSNGKMVAPLPIESRLAAHPWIAHAILHAEGKNFVSALIVLRKEVVEAWAGERGIDDEFCSLVSLPLVTAEVQKAVDHANASLSRAESIRRFVVIDRELSVAANELTPTHKVRRNIVLENYSAQLDALYGFPPEQAPIPVSIRIDT